METRVVKSDGPVAVLDDAGTSRDRAPGRDLQVLTACRQPVTLDEAVRLAKIPRSSLHRWLKKLHEQGLVRHQGETYSTTEAGLKLLETGDDSLADPDPFSKVWSFLQFFPTPLHRAIAA